MATSAKVFSGILERLYAASLEDALWRAFLSELCTATGSVMALLLESDSVRGQRTLAVGGRLATAGIVPPPDQATHDDPIRRAFLRRPRTGVIEVEDILAHGLLSRTAMYQQKMLPFQIAYGTCVIPSISPRRFELLTLWRSGERPRLELEQRELLELLFPHIRNALKVHEALEQAREQSANAQAMLDASATACILLDAAGRLVHMNTAARSLALASEGLTIRDERIHAIEKRGASKLARLIAVTAADPHHAGGSLLLARPKQRRPLQVMVSPFRVGEPHRFAGRVLVLLTDPDQKAVFHDKVLRELYELTPAEIELANGLMTGFSLEEIAAVREVAIGTVRSQLKSVMAKTGTSRQADLVRLLSSLPRPFRSTPGEPFSPYEGCEGKNQLLQ